MEPVDLPAPRSELRDVAWRVLVGLGSGAIAGFLIGGVGGRLAMLLLRLTSPDVVVGMTSDDGFEIGVVSTSTFNLLLGMTFFGALNGVVYVVLRGAIPRRLRLPLWSLLAAAIVGAGVVHEDGVDFQLLEPVGLAVGLFVALPAVAAALVAVLVERWIDTDPAEHRTLAGVLVVAALASTIGVLVATVAACATLGLRRLGRPPARLATLARVAVPLALLAVTLAAGVNLVRTASGII